MVEKNLAKVQSQFETIAVIQDLRSAGHTLQAIAAHLNTNGYQTQRGGKWYPTTVANVLQRGVTANESTRVS